MVIVYSLMYWLIILYFICSAIGYAKYKQLNNQNLLGVSWARIFRFIIFIPLLILAGIFQLLYILVTHILIKVMFPIIYALVVLFFFYITIAIISEFLVMKLNVEAAGYLILTLSAMAYAHTALFKKLYIFILGLFNNFANNNYTDEFVLREKVKVSGRLFSIHVYIVLFIVYLFFNLFGFMDEIEKGQFSFITESLLTFVIFDTLMNYKKDLSDKRREIN